MTPLSQTISAFTTFASFILTFLYTISYHGFPSRRYYTLEESDKAIESLCAINSPVTSNILHLVTRKRDIEVDVSHSEAQSSEMMTLSFQHQRDKASDELKKRGNPPYQPEAYNKSP